MDRVEKRIIKMNRRPPKLILKYVRTKNIR